MRIPRVVLLFISLLAIIQILPAKSDIAIMIDGSGSMMGFAQAGSIRQIVSNMVDAANKNKLSSEIMIFKSNDKRSISYARPANYHVPSVYNGQYTVLDKPLEEKKSKYGALLFLTDNLDNSSGNFSTKNFFAAIQNTREIKQLNVIPIITDFSGKTYTGNSNVYKGKRGLVAYLIIYSEDYNKFRNFRQDLPYDVLHFYPITAEHLNISRSSIKSSPYVLVSHGSRYVLSRDKRVQLARSLESSKWNEISFSFDLSSRYKHFYLKENTKVFIDNVSIDASTGKIPIECEYDITPNKLVEDLLPDQKIQSFSGILRIKPNPNLIQEFGMMLKQIPVQVFFTIHLQTEENGLSLVPEIQKEYFSKNPAKLDKIYSEEDLLSILNPYDNNIVLKVQNLNDRKHPESTIYLKSKNQFLFIMIALLLIAGIVLLVNYLIRVYSVKPIQLSDNGEDITLPRFSSHKGEHYVIHNGLKTTLTITSANWHMEKASTRSAKHTILPSITYILVNRDYTESIELRFKKL